MITDLYHVRKTQGEYDSISIITPDNTFDEAHGYSVGYRLLVVDGTIWVCTDATDDSATWGEDRSDIVEIHQQNRVITDLLCRYLDNFFINTELMTTLNDIGFTYPVNISSDTNDFTEWMNNGDTILVSGSRRNDGVYDAEQVITNLITVSQPIQSDGLAEDGITFAVAQYPEGLKDIAAQFVAYDLWTRPSQGKGVASESVGSYSYSKTTADVSGVGYPVDMVGTLQPYKRPKVR